MDVVERIGGEHTPRNTMIRAVRTNARAAPELWREYDEMRGLWGDAVAAEALAPEPAAAREEAMDPVPVAADGEVEFCEKLALSDDHTYYCNARARPCRASRSYDP